LRLQKGFKKVPGKWITLGGQLPKKLQTGLADLWVGMSCGGIGDPGVQKTGQHFQRLIRPGLRESFEMHFLRFAFEKLDVIGVLRPPGILFGDQQVHDIRQTGADSNPSDCLLLECVETFAKPGELSIHPVAAVRAPDDDFQREKSPVEGRETIADGFPAEFAAILEVMKRVAVQYYRASSSRDVAAAIPACFVS